MKIRINNAADEMIVAELAGLQDHRSLAALIAAYAETRCPEEEDFTADIAKAMLTDSYRSNPATLARNVLAKLLSHGFEDSSGYQTPARSTHVTIKILRERKPVSRRYTHGTPTAKQLIKEWLPLTDEPSLKLEKELIPPFLSTHPEQLSFQIKRETSTPIRILRTETHWIITRK